MKIASLILACFTALLPGVVLAQSCDLHYDDLMAPMDTHDFIAIDCNGDGEIDIPEAEIFLSKHAGLGAPDAAGLVSAFDTDNSGTISAYEYPVIGEIAKLIGPAPSAGFSPDAGDL